MAKAKNLKEFLSANPVDRTSKTVRLEGGRLEDFDFVIKPLTTQEFRNISKEVESYNGEPYDITLKTVLAGVIEPDFRDSEWIKETGLDTPIQLIEHTLTVAEINGLGEAILDISGILPNFEVAYKNAKN